MVSVWRREQCGWDFAGEDPFLFSDWFELFQLLSLEQTEPFLEVMGLFVTKPDGLRAGCRRLLEPQITPDGVRRPIDWSAEPNLVSDYFDALEVWVGSEEVENVYEYFWSVFRPASPRITAVDVWINLLWSVTWGYVPGDPVAAFPDWDEMDSAVSPAPAMEILALYRRYMPASLWDDEIENAKRSNVSPWDARVAEGLATDGSLLLRLRRVLRFNSMRRFWGQLEGLLGDQEFQQLLDWARRQQATSPYALPDLAWDDVQLPAFPTRGDRWDPPSLRPPSKSSLRRWGRFTRELFALVPEIEAEVIRKLNTGVIDRDRIDLPELRFAIEGFLDEGVHGPNLDLDIWARILAFVEVVETLRHSLRERESEASQDLAELDTFCEAGLAHEIIEHKECTPRLLPLMGPRTVASVRREAELHHDGDEIWAGRDLDWSASSTAFREIGLSASQIAPVS